MNLGLSAVLFLSSLTFSKHLSDAQSKVPDPFPCGSGLQLIPAVAQCDGYPDCPGGEDEHGCPPPHQEVHLSGRHQAGYQVRQQSAASQNWQRDFRNNAAVIKHSRPSQQQSKQTFISQNGGKLGTSFDYRQQQTYGIRSLGNKGNFKEKWIQEHLGSNNHEKSNLDRVALEKNSVISARWRMNSADIMQQQNIQAMNSADNVQQDHIQAMNSADNKRLHRNQALISADNKGLHQIQALNSAFNKRQHHIQALNVADNKRQKDLNLHNRITVQRQEHFHLPQEKVHHSYVRYGRHGGGYQTQASGTEVTSRIDKRVFQFPTNMKIKPPIYHRVDSQHLTHVQHIDKPREGFQKPVAFIQDTAQSWAKDRWTISILVVLTCISMFSMIVQCWFCK